MLVGARKTIGSRLPIKPGAIVSRTLPLSGLDRIFVSYLANGDARNGAAWKKRREFTMPSSLSFCARHAPMESACTTGSAERSVVVREREIVIENALAAARKEISNLWVGKSPDRLMHCE
jgi:hypothetical protein